MPKKDSKDAPVRENPETRTEVPLVLKQFPITQTAQVSSLETLRHVFRRPTSPLCEY
jgi:hypothetical protein